MALLPPLQVDVTGCLVQGRWHLRVYVSPPGCSSLSPGQTQGQKWVKSHEFFCLWVLMWAVLYVPVTRSVWQVTTHLSGMKQTLITLTESLDGVLGVGIPLGLICSLSGSWCLLSSEALSWGSRPKHWHPLCVAWASSQCGSWVPREASWERTRQKPCHPVWPSPASYMVSPLPPSVSWDYHEVLPRFKERRNRLCLLMQVAKFWKSRWDQCHFWKILCATLYEQSLVYRQRSFQKFLALVFFGLLQ